MDPLIITATPNISWLNPKIKFPKTQDEIAEAAEKSASAGASILHIHAEGIWKDAMRETRKRTNAIIQCGMSSLSIIERMDVFKEKADMISIILGHHDEAFVNVETHKLHDRQELIEYSKLLKKYNVRPEFEVWHAGHIWNLNFLIQGNHIDPPYFTTLFFGWPGGNWTPPTIDEYLYRRKLLPEKSVINVSVMGKEQEKIITAAILMGDHVRVGTEDHPYVGEKEATTEELVYWISDISKALGRRVANPDEARRIIGITG